MKPVTTTVRVPKAAKALAAVSLAVCVVFLIAVDTEKILAAGLSLGALIAIAAVVAYVRAPKRTVVLLDVRGDDLHLTSRTDPVNEIGLRYLPTSSIPIANIREIVTREVCAYRSGTYIDVNLTRRDGTMEVIYFPGELRDAVRAFFRQLQERWPDVEVVDGGYHTRVTWRSRWRAMIRPREPYGRKSE